MDVFPRKITAVALLSAIFLQLIPIVSSATPSNTSISSSGSIVASSAGREPPQVLNGFSGSVDSYEDIDDVIAALAGYGGNCYRIGFNPVWTQGTRPWEESTRYGPSGVDKINYFLENCDYYIIVDRNHFTDNIRRPYDDPNSNEDWVQVEQSIFDDVLSNWGNNPRVLVEVINEYPHSDMYVYVENIIGRIRDAGYTNKIVLDKHSQADDWERHSDETPSLDYYGHHFYFNNLNDPTMTRNTLWKAQEHMERAVDTGCYPIVNTEIGASFNEASSFTIDNVAITNEFLHWCNEREIGNMIWMNHGLRNLPRYEALGFDPQWTSSPPPPPSPEPIILDDSEADFDGNWPSSSYGSEYWDEDYNYNSAGSGGDTATWDFTVPETGTWEVYAWWPETGSKSTNTPYTISYAGGSTTIRVNQKADGSQWNSLGQYSFGSGTYSVVISDDADGTVRADAIRLVYVG